MSLLTIKLVEAAEEAQRESKRCAGRRKVRLEMLKDTLLATAHSLPRETDG